ncbi:hypothetical protein HOLleu_26744 [Holothuria leucospilota]|uniref:Uncharacterized protein n=1 Tax=Holothuria leucospilota TaxID=206669 RepID=A0A9Q1BPR7_HOLLE|nr:hypothetical protein HOLleu_26744 [Holothuria leucospilota]
MAGRGRPKGSVGQKKKRDDATAVLTSSGRQPVLSSILTRTANAEEDSDLEQNFVKNINNNTDKLRKRRSSPYNRTLTKPY